MVQVCVCVCVSVYVCLCLCVCAHMRESNSFTQVFFFVFSINTFYLINFLNLFPTQHASPFLYYHCSHSGLFVPNPFFPPLCLYTVLSFSCIVQLPFVYQCIICITCLWSFCFLFLSFVWATFSLLKFFPFTGD